MTVGDFFSFTLYLGMLVGPVVQIVNIGSQITEAFAGLERIREIRNEADRGRRRGGARAARGGSTGRIEFRDVCFEYQPGSPVLHGISFVARPGTSTALVGPSGSGKSTLIGLVGRLPPADLGRASWSTARTSRRCGSHDYRSQLGVVFQDNFLFDGTVLENIAYARPDASEEEVLRAAADRPLRRLRGASCRDGYDTIVGERGVKLSGGERQRVAIARAILADPRILILDEATSSLDSESEALIQEGLAELMKGRTTFVIAHRLSTIRARRHHPGAGGRPIVERGRHEELLALGGRYHALYTRQYDLESNLFRNPGEAAAADPEESPVAAGSADASVERVSLLPG